MKLYTTNRINALGLKGPEQIPEAIKQFLKIPTTHIPVDNGNIQESEQILYNKAKQIFTNSGDKVSLPLPTSEASHQRSVPPAKRPENLKIFIGGDHSITYPLFKAFQKQHENPFLIIFDAHADCMSPQQEPTHEEFLRAIIEQGFPSNKIILIGVRKIEPEEQEFLDAHKIKIIQDPKQILSLTKDKDLYISIDIDALDPKSAPAVNYPEPNGLIEKEFFHIFEQLLRQNPKAIDIVEAVPQKDQDNKTLKLIIKIIKETTL